MKGYWQIPLATEVREKTAFSTPFGLYQFKTRPFSLRAKASFQCLMDYVLQPHRQCAVAHIDNIVIYNYDWKEHLRHLTALLQSLKEARLMAK